MVVAGLTPKGQRDAGIGAGPLKQFGPQFALEEGVGVADVDQQFLDPRAIFDQRDGIVGAPCGSCLLYTSDAADD